MTRRAKAPSSPYPSSDEPYGEVTRASELYRGGGERPLTEVGRRLVARLAGHPRGFADSNDRGTWADDVCAIEAAVLADARTRVEALRDEAVIRHQEAINRDAHELEARLAHEVGAYERVLYRLRTPQ